MKNLENYGVLELNSSEFRTTEGGYWLLAAVIYFAIETVTNPVSSGNAFTAGIDAGYNYNH